MSNYDIIIIGSGIIGLTTALLLAKNPSLKIAVIEANESPHHWQENQPYDHRVSAITLAAKNIFHYLHCWDEMKNKRISSYTQMQVWDEGSHGEINFDCASLHKSALGYIVEDKVMRSTLLAKLQAAENVDFLCPLKLQSLTIKKEFAELVTADQLIYKTKLIIAADGANSWVRAEANIALKSWDYQHTAIVATVQTELPHQATARQRFLMQGPLAFLPLNDPHTCSIVWSVSADCAAQLLSLEDEAFKKILAEQFENKLGAITHVAKRYHFPLKMRHAKQYVQPRLALVGDAAHTIHPLAGQGVNLGLLDAASLAEVIQCAINKNRDFASFATLRRYERWRKTDTVAMLSMVEVLKYLFASEKKSIQKIRGLGLNLTNQFSLLKNFFANYAIGERDDLPLIAK